MTNSSAVLVVVNSEVLWEQSMKKSPLGPQSHDRSQGSIPRGYQSSTGYEPTRFESRFEKDYRHVMQSWNQDQIQAAKIDPVLYLQPVIKYLADNLSSKILKLRDLHRKYVSSRPEKKGVLLLESVANKIEILCSELHDFDLFIQDLRDSRESNAQALTTKEENLMSYCEEVPRAGRRTTQLIRDMLQTSLSLWSIRESNRSIEEAISVKRLTQLAFIFVPLGFVTSLFGMNVQQLSGNGVELWVFLVTAVCLGGSVLLFWRLLNPIQAWWKRHPPRKPFKWYWFRQLIRHECLLGAIKTGAIIGFLTIGRFGPQVQDADDSSTYYNALFKLSKARSRQNNL